MNLSDKERRQIAEILKRRSNDIATFKDQLEKRVSTKFDDLPGSVEMALSREIQRLRRLADKIAPRVVKEEEDEE